MPISELSKASQRHFINTYRREQSKVDNFCPNVFTLTPAENQPIGMSLLGQKLELQLWCQAEGCWHPLHKGKQHTGRYTLDQPASWLRQLAPHIQRLSKFLKFAVPLIGPWVQLIDPGTYTKDFQRQVKLTEDLTKVIPSSWITSDVDYPEELEPKEPIASGADLRALRRLLDSLDPEQNWGGLRLILTPEGQYLWLCEHHAQEYKTVLHGN